MILPFWFLVLYIMGFYNLHFADFCCQKWLEETNVYMVTEILQILSICLIVVNLWILYTIYS